MSAKAIAGRARDIRRAKVSPSKLKSKKNFNAHFTYITSTGASRTELLRRRKLQAFAAASPLRAIFFLRTAEERCNKLVPRLSGRRLRGGRAAVKIRCLLGRSRLRRKRGRLFLRLGRRSESEPPATHLIGLTPSSFFSSVIAVRRSSTHRFWPLRKGDYEWQSTMWRLSEAVRAGMWRRSGRANLA